jgi:FKBP-type peptidyl-prolyl cis-trans isomerase 2
MAQAKHGDTVRVHYTGKLEDGTPFDSSADRQPLEFTIGAGEVISGVEHAVVGMAPGDSKSAHVPPEQGYGDYRRELLTVVNRDRLPSNLNPTVGQRLQVQQEGGRQFTVKVAEVSTSTVTLDANHELAGKPLVFDLELVEVL